MLFGVARNDLMTFAGVAVVIVAVALLATLIAKRRARTPFVSGWRLIPAHWGYLSASLTPAVLTRTIRERH